MNDPTTPREERDVNFYVLCPICLTYINPEVQHTLCPHLDKMGTN